MKVLKFGGGVLNSSKSIVELYKILTLYNENIIVVVSAFGKVTSLLEKIIFTDISENHVINQLRKLHYNIASELFSDNTHKVFKDLKKTFLDIENKITCDYQSIDEKYDQIVSFGETLSSTIVFHYIKEQNKNVCFTDICNIIKTDSSFREAKVKWDITEKTILDNFTFNKTQMYLTQGFIASDLSNNRTTLGREGSDFTASVIAYCMNAEKVEFWKEVKGIYNADPTKTKDFVFLDKLSYREAVEQVYFGAKVLHPKTIKPLQNKKIPISVRPFYEPSFEGTQIIDISKFSQNYYPKVPIYIIKENQILISVSPLDFSFIAEDNLKSIFSHIANLKVKINLIQNSAISFSFSADNSPSKVTDLISNLKNDFKVKYNENITLITIRHYNPEAIDKMTMNKKIYLEQKSRHTVRFLIGN